ncbi:MAG: hypothetical protein IJ440_05575 [Alphaproteobacteria bacterium]|nr:hypothetical protein [Alphaproteobacteria bacterium]
MKYTIFILNTLLILGGCYNTPYQKFNSKETPIDWIGETPSALISSWGNPTQVINDNTFQYITYTLQNGQNINKSDDTSFTPNEGFCEVTFFVQEGLITKVNQVGNTCQ